MFMILCNTERGYALASTVGAIVQYCSRNQEHIEETILRQQVRTSLFVCNNYYYM